MVCSNGWDNIPEGKAAGKFLKWKPGKNRVRFFGTPVSYMREWPNGIKEEVAINVLDLDDNSLPKIATLKKAMLKTLRAIYEETGGDLGGKVAPSFSITREGSGMETNYVCLPSKETTLPDDLNVAEHQAELIKLAEKLEKTPSKPVNKLSAVNIDF